MLTRLKVSGFKNLVNVEVRFGPFTCIAGANGVGKSNLLDAIAFLSALADRGLTDAALSVRDDGTRSGDIRSIFHKFGNQQASEMSFEADMIIPQVGTDDLGQVARATTSFLRYRLDLALRAEESPRSLGPLEIMHEELTHIRAGDAKKQIAFPVDGSWFQTAVTGRRWTRNYISTENKSGNRLINVHQDGGSSGKPRPLLASTLPRTAISAANAAESPTATLVKREMQSWKRLQLEPSALRRPDGFNAPTSLSVDGAHVPATLYDLAHHPDLATHRRGDQVFALVANRLSELIEDVRHVDVERDEKRELLTLRVRGSDLTWHSARALSDGTLRFVALATLEIDPDFAGVLCLEEPENGIHPARIPAMLRLLQDIATDVRSPVASDNPLRQVIVNTHSPSVVAQVSEDSLLVAETMKVANEFGTYDKVAFSCLPETWRASAGTRTVSKGQLLSYLAPVPKEPPEQWQEEVMKERGTRRVIDDPDLQIALFGEHS